MDCLSALENSEDRLSVLQDKMFDVLDTSGEARLTKVYLLMHDKVVA